MTSNAQRIADDIMELLREEGTLTFARMAHAIEGFSGGDKAIGPTAFNNVIFWDGLTDDAAEAVELIRPLTSLCEISPLMGMLCYVQDGGVMTLPLVKIAGIRKYKRDHWLPAVLKEVK